MYKHCSSGRPEFRAKNREETEKYLLDGLEFWRKKMGLKKIHLCGHSLGGYVATKYAGQYEKNILSLMLISPAGIWPRPPSFRQELKDTWKKMDIYNSLISRLTTKYWVPGKSPFQVLRSIGWASLLFLKVEVQSYASLDKNERRDVLHYLFQILMNRGTGELAMSYLLYPVLKI